MILWQLILIQVITFGLLVYLLRHLLYRQVTHSVARLEQLYQENLRREEELKKAKGETEQALKAEMAQRREEMRRLRAEAEGEVHRIKEEAQAKAKEEAERIVAEAVSGEERMRARLISEGEAKAVDLAFEILKRIFSTRVAEAVHHHLIDGLIEEIQELDGQRLQTDIETAEVRIPFPLTQDQRGTLNQVLSSKIGRRIILKESNDRDIIAGMIVHLDHLVLDGSLQNKLKGVMAHVRESLAR